ncbi:M15 family metallopeptidase [Photobacterium nomapromontoriensis]|uniref:M15 family metallopeptidase n=1 Tax=Photobacterium nomapromontoriensis TaxID=2910237 RepID=UPI003D143FE8
MRKVQLINSVGIGGENKYNDIKSVQIALNLLGFKDGNNQTLSEDGSLGRNPEKSKTVAALKRCQKDLVRMVRPDGRIDINGRTHKKINDKLSSIAPVAAAGNSSATATQVNANSKDPRKLKTREAVAAVYGEISANKTWANQIKYHTKYTLPSSLTSHRDYNWISVFHPQKIKLKHFYCNKDMIPFLDKALSFVVDRGLVAELKEFGGSIFIRSSRGASQWSAHAWSLAIDINMTGNGLGQEPSMNRELVKCFKDAGFGWGGDYSRKKDGMHFTLAGFDMPASS